MSSLLPATSPNVTADSPSVEFPYTWIDESWNGDRGLYFRTYEEALSSANDNYVNFEGGLADREVIILKVEGYANNPSSIVPECPPFDSPLEVEDLMENDGTVKAFTTYGVSLSERVVDIMNIIHREGNQVTEDDTLGDYGYDDYVTAKYEFHSSSEWGDTSRLLKVYDDLATYCGIRQNDILAKHTIEKYAYWAWVNNNSFRLNVLPKMTPPPLNDLIGN